MIHLIGDYYMTADKKPGCSYVVGIPRQTEDKRIIMRQARYSLPLPVPWQKPQKSHCVTKSQLAKSLRCMTLWRRSAA